MIYFFPQHFITDAHMCLMHSNQAGICVEIKNENVRHTISSSLINADPTNLPSIINA